MEKNMTTMHAKNLQQISAGQRIMSALVKLGTYAFLVIMALIVLFPFYWMIISSLKTEEEYRATIPTFWPQRLMFGNYAKAFTDREKLANILCQMAKPGDTILFKGSHGMHMELVLDIFLKTQE